MRDATAVEHLNQLQLCKTVFVSARFVDFDAVLYNGVVVFAVVQRVVVVDEAHSLVFGSIQRGFVEALFTLIFAAVREIVAVIMKPRQEIAGLRVAIPRHANRQSRRFVVYRQTQRPEELRLFGALLAQDPWMKLNL